MGVVSTAPGVCVCVCFTTVCVCPLLQVCVCVFTTVCVHLDGVNAENHISMLVILCIIVYVTKKYKKNIGYRFFFFKTDIRLW